jgi:hypothetical protein
MPDASKLRLINPIGVPQKGGEITLAKRLPSLEGKTIGLIDNMKPNVGPFLDRIKERITEQFPSVNFMLVRKNFTSSRLIANELEGRVQGLINAWGD